MKRDYLSEFDTIKADVIHDIELLVRENNGRINIPFFIDEDDDYEVKLEDIVECYGDGYDVRVGDPYNNFSIEWKDITDTYLLHDDVLSVELNSFNETMIISEQGSNHLYDLDNMLSLIRLYETLYRLTH